MQVFLHILTTAAILAHALIGCDEHHHAPESTVAPSVSNAMHVDQAALTCDQHEQHTPDSSEPTLPHDCGRCDCPWLTGTAPDLDLDAEYVSGFATIGDSTASSQVANSVESFDTRAASSISALGLRAHLSLGVLLI